MTNDIEKLRAALRDIEKNTRVEMNTISLRSAWPLIEHLVIALSYTDPVRRSDACSRFTDDLVRLIGETRQRINAANRWIEAEERNAARARLRAVGE